MLVQCGRHCSAPVWAGVGWISCEWTVGLERGDFGTVCLSEVSWCSFIDTPEMKGVHSVTESFRCPLVLRALTSQKC